MYFESSEKIMSGAEDQSRPHMRYRLLFIACAVVVLLCLAWFALSAPRRAPIPAVVTIEKGSSLIGMSAKLKSIGIIRSETLFQAFAILFSGDRKLPAGDFAFEAKEPVYIVAWRIAHGDFGIARKKLTIPEGSTVRDIAAIARSSLINFDADAFIASAEKKEGYLFPDTYFFFSNATPDEVIAVLEATFKNKMTALADDFAASKRTREDIITMASIIEAEANKSADRRIVSGILWKRIDTGMRLQVDAPFFYLRQESAEKEVTVSDLSVVSPYNTYAHKGLPPGPIGNPGIDSMLAALHPEPSPYLYYLYGKDGTIRYARTFEEHKANKARYLK